MPEMMRCEMMEPVGVELRRANGHGLGFRYWLFYDYVWEILDMCCIIALIRRHLKRLKMRSRN